MAAFAGLNALMNRSEQRNSHMRHPVHLVASMLIGVPFLLVAKASPQTMFYSRKHRIKYFVNILGCYASINRTSFQTGQKDLGVMAY